MTVRKKRATQKCNPFSESGVLQRVLDFVGAGHCLFMALVSREWRLLYSQVADCIAEGVDDDTDEGAVEITCTAKMTLASAAFASKQKARLAHECGLNLAEGTFSLQFIAGKHGDKKVLALLRELRLPFTASVACGAAAAGSLAKLKWLHTEHRCELTSDVADYAAGNGNLAVLKYLQSNGCEFTLDTSYNAAAAGHIHVLEYLVRQFCPWNAEACNAAAAGGHLAAVRWLREHSCPWDNDKIAQHAAESGSIPVMEYVRQQGAVLTIEVMQKAVQHGHAALCKQLQTRLGCPFNAAVCTSAALGGHADMLRCLFSNRLFWTAEDIVNICYGAAKGGSTEILIYLVDEAGTILNYYIILSLR
jgi:hypothetical protein